jgi:hypothetical protein
MPYSTFLDDLRDFPTKSPPWYLISGRKKSRVFIFCCFRDLIDLKLIGDFYNINILSREASGEVEANERSHEAQKSLSGMTHCPGWPTRARLALVRRLVFVFLWMPSF